MNYEKIKYENPNRSARCRFGSPLPAKTVKTYVFHFHPEIELLYIVRGRMKNVVEGEEFVALPGDIVFFNSRVPHDTQSLEDGTVRNMVQFRIPSTFDGAFRYLAYFLSSRGKDFFVFKKEDEDYEVLCAHIFNMLERDSESGAAADCMLTSDIYFITSLLYRRGFLQDERDVFDFGQLERLVPLFEYIDGNFADELSLEKCAELLSLNKSYLCRIFRKATGMTLTDFINLVRVSKSEEMLSKNKNLSEIAYAVGFSSLAYFNRTFKKYKKASPSEYRKLYKKREYNS